MIASDSQTCCVIARLKCTSISYRLVGDSVANVFFHRHRIAMVSLVSPITTVISLSWVGTLDLVMPSIGDDWRAKLASDHKLGMEFLTVVETEVGTSYHARDRPLSSPPTSPVTTAIMARTHLMVSLVVFPSWDIQDISHSVCLSN